MKRMFRVLIGQCVALFYIVIGKRQYCLRQYDCEGNVLSLYSHNPKPEVLNGVLSWLKSKGFTFVSTDDLLMMQSGKKKWGKRLAWLTFDDGWKGFEDNLLPILEKHDCPATIFVPPNEIIRGQIWTNSIMSEVEDITPYYTLEASERYMRVDDILKNIGNPRCLATKEELKRIAQHSLITLENHTYSHLSCRFRPTEDVVAEVKKTQKILEEWTGRLPRLVCYPFGHYADEVDENIKKCGLVPVHSHPGIMTINTIGDVRNMFTETMSNVENIGRILGAWVEVKA